MNRDTRIDLLQLRRAAVVRQPSLRAAVLFFCVVVLLLLACVSAASALEPPRPGELARLEREGTLAEALQRARALGNYRISPDLLESAELRARRAALGITSPAPPSAWTGMPTTGSVKVLTLLIDFPDYPHKNAASTINAKLFGGGVGSNDFPYESLHNYYQRSSYGQLDIGGNVLGWYRTAYSRSSVTQTRTGRENLIREALAYYDTQGHDFSQYDNNGDGAIDYFVVVWTGPEGDWATFWWGYQTSFVDSSFVLDGKTLDKYSWQWECYYDGATTNGVYDQIVVLHETGHALGLPDYYDYDDTVGPDGGVGQLDMMDTNWGDHNSFSKWILGWITPQVITGVPRSVTLAASGTSSDALVVMPTASAGDPFREYFVVQNRQRVGNDSNCVTWPYQNMPADGLLIWHVDARLQSTPYGDDYVSDNSYTAHKLLRLMEADGLNQIETVPSYWVKADDYYDSGHTFTNTSNPDSRKYDGSASNVAVTGIPGPSSSMTLTAGVSGTTPTDTTKPHTTASGYDAAWHASPVTVTFSAADEAGGSGVDYTEYELDDLGWTHGTSVVLPAEPDTVHVWTIKYRSVDVAGNVEDYHTCQVKIDTSGTTDETAPTVETSGPLDDWYYNNDQVLTLTASDEPGGSGVAGIAYTVDGAYHEALGSTVDIPFAAVPNGVHTVTYHAWDVAGHHGPDATFRITMDTGGPVGYGRDAGVHKGRYVNLRYKFADTYSTAVWNVKVKVKNRRGATVWSKSLPALTLKWVGTWYAFRWRPKAKGAFSYLVTCEDNAGNLQARRATGTIRVR